jgi:hypothetical protein
MKKNLIMLALSALLYAGNGQSLQLSYRGTTYSHNDTIPLNILSGSQTYNVDIKNVSSDTVKVMVKRERIVLLSGAENYFCFGSCFGSEIDITSDSYPLAPGVTSSHDSIIGHEGDPAYFDYAYFYTVYDPKEKEGESLIKFTFYNEQNPADETSLLFKFISNKLGVATINTNTSFVQLYPNPAQANLFIKTEATIEQIGIYTVQGQLIKKESTNVNFIAVDDFASGMYSVRITTDKGISIKNFVKQ